MAGKFPPLAAFPLRSPESKYPTPWGGIFIASEAGQVELAKPGQLHPHPHAEVAFGSEAQVRAYQDYH